MRFIFAIAGSCLFRTALAVAACPDLDVNWYSNLVYCGFAATNTLDQTEVDSCLDGFTTLPAGVTKSTSLAAHFSTAATSCTPYALAFANSVFALQSSFSDSCGFSTWTDQTLSMITNINSSGCLDLLYNAIETFNDDALNTTVSDLVTGIDSTRCETDAFNTFLSNERPWGDMVALITANNAVYDGTNYAVEMPSGYVAALTALVTATNTGCGACVNTLYNDLELVLPAAACTTSAYSSACLLVVADAVENFAVCTGGHHISTHTCTAAQIELFDTVYRPYNAYVTCQEDWDAEAPSAFNTCVAVMTGIRQPPATNCDPCYTPLKQGIQDNYDAACSDPFATACVTAMTDDDITGYLGGALTQFEVCSGFEMNTDPTVCSSYERNNLAYEFKSFVPMLIAAKYADDMYDAADMISTSDDLAALYEALDGLTCESCFNAFMADANFLYNNDSDVYSDCADPYSTDCADIMADALDRFESCSGFSLNRGPNITVCTASEFDDLLALGVSDDVVAAAVDSSTTIRLLSALADVLDTIETEELDAPCWICFTELARAINDLGATDLGVCEDDITGDDCYDIIGSFLDGFETCSGSTFALKTITTTTTTTTSTTATTTASTTATGTTTTTAATTTKSTNLAASISLMLIVVAITL